MQYVRCCTFPAVTQHVNQRILQLILQLITSFNQFIEQVIWIKPEWQIIDPLCTFFFSILVLTYTMPLITRIANVLLEGKPEHVSV